LVCARCQQADSKVLETRASPDGVRRRRQCLGCGHRFTTHEREERRLPLVIKKDGSRQPFDRDKLLFGLSVACRKRPISAEHLEAVVGRVEQQLMDRNLAELPSSDIGQCVLWELQGLDLVAWLRFASVYREVSSAEDFLTLLQPWLRPGASP
jgi:transcriptional repressor NrdR